MAQHHANLVQSLISPSLWYNYLRGICLSLLCGYSSVGERKEGVEIDFDSSDGKVEHDIVDNGDRTYKVTYTADKQGAYSIAVKCYDKHIPGSPFSLTVVPRADASKCKAEGPALHPNSLKIEGNPLNITVDTTQAGTGNLQVEVKGPDGIELTVYIANEDGIYSLKFDVPKAGKYFVHIRWAGEHIPAVHLSLRYTQDRMLVL